MTEESMELAGQITGALYDFFFSHLGRFRFGAEEYDIADEQQYASLGENALRADAPLILVRRSDGKFFEVELDASAGETTAEERQADRERMQQIREATQARRNKDG